MSVLIPDGNDAVRGDIDAVVDLLVRTSRWVHPETFKALPVWCPWVARGQPLFDAAWQGRYTNTKRATGLTSEKFEGNVAAAKALIAALDVATPRPSNWTVCHIWGYDDPNFGPSGSVVHDPRFYSCIGNMVWLPTSLKGFTDSLPEVKSLLRVCAYYLYGFLCDHPNTQAEAQRIGDGWIPAHYPSAWPTNTRADLPPGTSPFTHRIKAEIVKRKTKWESDLSNPALTSYPREQVRTVLQYWKVELPSTELARGP
jgi:hypothetical protein